MDVASASDMFAWYGIDVCMTLAMALACCDEDVSSTSRSSRCLASAKAAVHGLPLSTVRSLSCCIKGCDARREAKSCNCTIAAETAHSHPFLRAKQSQNTLAAQFQCPWPQQIELAAGHNAKASWQGHTSSFEQRYGPSLQETMRMTGTEHMQVTQPFGVLSSASAHQRLLMSTAAHVHIKSCIWAMPYSSRAGIFPKDHM